MAGGRPLLRYGAALEERTGVEDDFNEVARLIVETYETLGKAEKAHSGERSMRNSPRTEVVSGVRGADNSRNLPRSRHQPVAVTDGSVT
jgi:hypothetical protein